MAPRSAATRRRGHVPKVWAKGVVMQMSVPMALEGGVVATEGLVLYLALLCIMMAAVIAAGIALRHRALR